MRFELDDSKVQDDTLLKIKINYEGQSSDKTWTYALIKAGGRWYVTGYGRTPQDAGWAAVANWLQRDGRTVQSVEVVTGTAEIYRIGSSPA